MKLVFRLSKKIDEAYFLAILFIVVSAFGLSFAHEGWTSYLTKSQLFYDAGHYLKIALSSYSDPGSYAFYPLWPHFLKIFSIFGLDVEKVSFLANVLSFFLFFLSIAAFIQLLKKHIQAWLIAPVSLLYVFNPNSVFHALPFSESLCSVFLALLLLETTKNKASLTNLFVLSFLVSLTRPVVFFLPLSALLAWFFTYIVSAQNSRMYFAQSLSISLGSLVGFACYGFYCWKTSGNFFQSVDAQQKWDRVLGFNWNLIFHPKSVGGSHHVLFWDLIAFYGPVVLLLLGTYTFLKRKDSPLASSFSFWWSTFFALGHSAIAFLTYPVFMSLGRHVLALPTFYFSLGIVLNEYLKKKTAVSSRVLGFCVLLSCFYFVKWWMRFARNSWIG